MLLFSHQDCLDHDTGPGHPERRARLVSLLAAVRGAAIPGLVEREAPPAAVEVLARVHPRAHVEAVLAAVPAQGTAYLDPDTPVGPGSGLAALRAAGAATAAIDAVVGGEARTAFCAVRPPGHHAEPDRAMGFCLFGNVAVAARHARAAHGLGRIAIVDFDVHHGNGTQATFWDDPDTLFVSTHEWPLYPGTGAADERGAHDNILNCPLPAGTGSAAFRAVVDRHVLPVIDAFAPELVLISAGFDAHRRDPLANLLLEAEDFAWVTRGLVELAQAHSRGRVVALLEGGYDLEGLTQSAVAHIRELA